MATFQDRLNKALEESGISQSELGRRSHIDRSVINGYVHGKYVAKQTNLYNLAKVLNVDEGWLMGVSTRKERKKSNTFLSKSQNSSIASTDESILDDDKVDELVNGFRSYKGIKVSSAQKAAIKATMKAILNELPPDKHQEDK